jgi:hypothetical protein
MLSRSLSLIVQYFERPFPTLKFGFVEKQKKNLRVVHEETFKLESYQVENGNLKDERVIADRVLKIIDENEFKVSSGVHVIVHSPRLLMYSAILPKMNPRKAKTMAHREIDEMMVKHDEYYSLLTRVYDAKEKGVMVYMDLFPVDLLNSLVNLGDQLDRLIESVTKGAHGLADYYNSLNAEEANALILYGNAHLAVVALVIDGTYIDGLTIFHPPSDDETFMGELHKSIRLLTGKHQFAFERENVKNTVVLIEDEGLRETIEHTLENDLNLNILHVEIDSYQNIPYTIILGNRYLDFSFDIKG